MPFTWNAGQTNRRTNPVEFSVRSALSTGMDEQGQLELRIGEAVTAQDAPQCDALTGAAVSLTIADLSDAAHLAFVGDPSRCLTAEEAAEHLSVGRTTVYRLLAAGELLSITIGRSRRIPLSSIAAYVTRRIAAAVDGNADETLGFS